MKYFINGEPEDIAVHGGHAMQLPVLRMLLDVLVDFVPMFDDSPNKRFGEEPHGGFLGGRQRQLDFLSPGGRAFFFRERGGLLRDPELVERRLQIFRRLQIVLKEELNSAFPRLASSAHTRERTT